MATSERTDEVLIETHEKRRVNPLTVSRLHTLGKKRQEKEKKVPTIALPMATLLKICFNVSSSILFCKLEILSFTCAET